MESLLPLLAMLALGAAESAAPAEPKMILDAAGFPHPSVSAAMDALLDNRDATVTMKAGWTSFEETVDGQPVHWSFTPENHAAHPSAVRRTPVEKDGEIPSQPRFVMTDDNTVLRDDLTRCDVGEVGKLARRGHIPFGYYKDEEKTAATFLVDPDGKRWVIPGDSATISADGVLELLGRGSVCINTGGEKVYPEEVEGVLKAHPDVFDAVVVGVPDERWGERVVAVVQPREGAHVTVEDVHDHVHTRLAGYKTPRAVVEVDEVVRSPMSSAPWARMRATTSSIRPPAPRLDPPRASERFTLGTA